MSTLALMTVRRALHELQDLGLGQPRHGAGWFVTQPPDPDLELLERAARLENEVCKLRARLDVDHDSTVA